MINMYHIVYYNIQITYFNPVFLRTNKCQGYVKGYLLSASKQVYSNIPTSIVFQHLPYFKNTN